MASGDALNETDNDEESIKLAEQRRAIWRRSPEYRKGARAYWTVSAVCGSISLLILYIGGRAAHIPFNSFHFSWKIEGPYIINAWAILIGGVFIASFYRVACRHQFDDRMTIESQLKLASAESRLAETGNLDLASLWALTQQRLDYYHEIATDQARYSFRNAQAAMAIGFLVLATTITLAFTAKSTVSSIVTGALGGIGAALASYIGRTFIRAQESTAAHLRSYFDQPLQFSRFLTAERLLTTVNIDARPAIVEQMIKAIIGSADPSSASASPPSS